MANISKLRGSMEKRIPDAESRMSILRRVRMRLGERRARKMALNDILGEEIRRETRDFPGFLSAMSAKELLEKHLRERRDTPKKPIAEKDVLQAIDRLKGAASTDKSVLDIMYALADISPFESARRLASGVISGAKGKK